MMVREKVILASKSAARVNLLQNAGLEVKAIPASIDENVVKTAILSEDQSISAADFADILAQSKANSISENHGGTPVIGADQVLVLNGDVYDKPRNKYEARDQLVTLRGKTHELISAVAVSRRGATEWSFTAHANLTMCDFSNEFLGYYLAAMGDTVTESVGGYKLEGLGSQLFEKVEGDYFTILGLPLLPLLGQLRKMDVLYA
ncbi:MAG: Maf family protein [Hyphomicrobiales bacterium]